jgi:hypothetical protein
VISKPAALGGSPEKQNLWGEEGKRVWRGKEKERERERERERGAFRNWPQWSVLKPLRRVQVQNLQDQLLSGQKFWCKFVVATCIGICEQDRQSYMLQSFFFPNVFSFSLCLFLFKFFLM